MKTFSKNRCPKLDEAAYPFNLVEMGGKLYFMLFVSRFMLFVARFMLFVARSMLFVSRFMLFVARFVFEL